MRAALRIVALVVAALCGAAPAWAIGEVITDVRIRDNVRTQEDAVRSLAGIEVGDTLRADTLETVRERLNSSGLFADVNVFWEPYRHGVRVNISVKDKIPWAPVPTFSYSAGNASAGLVLVHGNLFGRGKRGVIGGRLSTADSGALIAYEDPAVVGSWAFFRLTGRYQDRILAEYGSFQTTDPVAIRETRLRQASFSANAGIAWFRRVKTAIGYTFEDTTVVESMANAENPAAPRYLPPAATGGRRGVGEAYLSFDFRARDNAVMYGNALSFNASRSSQALGAERKFTYWKAGVDYEHGFRLFRSHNLVLRLSAIGGERQPFWVENYLGGANLRGYVHRQFTGDSQLSSQVEYHFPMFSAWGVQVRGVGFWDQAAIWYRNLPPKVTPDTYALRPDGRQFLPVQYVVQGFDRDRDVHGGAGVGLRFFVKWVAVPLVGADFGRGFYDGAPWRLVLVIGA